MQINYNERQAKFNFWIYDMLKNNISLNNKKEFVTKIDIVIDAENLNNLEQMWIKSRRINCILKNLELKEAENG